jgi:hypothetical protein
MYDEYMYSIPSLFAVDTFHHFEPPILDSHDKKAVIDRNFVLDQFADKNSANNEGLLYLWLGTPAVLYMYLELFT